MCIHIAQEKKWALPLLSLFLLSFLSTCKGPRSQMESPTQSLESFLHAFPDSLRQNPFGSVPGFDLDQAATSQLIQDKSYTVSEASSWQLRFEDEAQPLLRLEHSGGEDGLRYQVLYLAGDQKEYQVLVVQQYDDHCCSYGRWGMYGVKKGVLTDETSERLPQLSWQDFFPEVAIDWGSLPSLQDNRFPFAMQVKSDPIQIELTPGADYFELNFAPEVSGPIMNSMEGSQVVLRWENGQFKR